MGGVEGAADTCPSGRRIICGEGKKGSASPFNEEVTRGPDRQSREVTAETETERCVPGIAEV